MSSNNAITVKGVGKLFRKQHQRTFKEFLPALFGGRPTSETFWALKDISFEVGQGETIGIIGPNGSGKSTLLKLLAGVSQPTEGEIKISGRIAPLIELGAGFHPELTGRENVYLNGVILGLKRAEVEAKFKEIVDFAELWEFIDQPVKHYSSGMYLRLAFAVAVHTDPEILLIDEILAVGDASFREKCMTKIKEFQKLGKTLIIVSHEFSTIRQLSNRVLLFDKSQLLAIGKADKIISQFSTLLNLDSKE